MSIVIAGKSYQLKCDVCGRKGGRGMPPQGISATEHLRYFAHQQINHWVFVDGKDICYRCKGPYERGK